MLKLVSSARVNDRSWSYRDRETQHQKRLQDSIGWDEEEPTEISDLVVLPYQSLLHSATREYRGINPSIALRIPSQTLNHDIDNSYHNVFFQTIYYTATKQSFLLKSYQ